jgi:AcrR family transcriptional regulator
MMAGPHLSGAGAPPVPPSRRQAQARRNDRLILAAARDVFLRDPRSPISAVADEAGVGISALYRRYPSKETLLQRLCADGLRRHVELAEEALDPSLDPWDAFAGFVTGIVESDVHALTAHLVGTSTPTAELRELAGRANALTEKLIERTHRAKAVRPDLGVRDLPMLFEQLSAVRVQDSGRTATLRLRYAALLLDALRPGAATGSLPGPPPTEAELGERWVTD